jgi:trehalose 6-phosphate phosphatase
MSPEYLAGLVAHHVPHVVLGLDVDGVLAPIVAHAADARLLEGVAELLEAVALVLPVAVVSGRSLTNLEAQFAFPPTLEVIGSHGLEWRSGEAVVLDDAQQALLDTALRWVDEAVEAAGQGAWCETKPTSVVLHVRQADPHRASAALGQLRAQVTGSGARVKEGHAVLEVMVLDTSKAIAMQTWRIRHGATCMAFIGDDVTDEDVFVACEPGDITVRVGAGDTAAHFRLPDPASVASFLRYLVASLHSG